MAKKARVEVQHLFFTNQWIGSANTAWEDPLNWSCGIIPDENNDVLINPDAIYNPVVNTNAS